VLHAVSTNKRIHITVNAIDTDHLYATLECALLALLQLQLSHESDCLSFLFDEKANA
jgi:hypothetical protein